MLLIEGIWPQNQPGKLQTYLGNDALDWPILVSAFYTEVLTNFVYPLCALALAVFWLCLWYSTIRHRNVTKPPTVVVVLYESKLLLIWFCPTDEWTLVLAYNEGEPEFLLQITFLCILLLYAGLRLLHLKVLHSMHVLCFHTYTGYLFLLLEFCHCDNSTQCLALWLLQSPHCQISETANYPGYTLRVLTALLGLPSFLNFGPKLDESTLNCSEYVYWMRGIPG